MGYNYGLLFGCPEVIKLGIYYGEVLSTKFISSKTKRENGEKLVWRHWIWE